MWNAISDSARKLGDSAADQARKAKLLTDILMIDRSIDARKRGFGVSMYDYLSPLSKSQDFYAASDKLTEIVRPILISAQKEIQALAGKRAKQKEALAKAEANRAAAFPTKAETYGQKLFNIGKASVLHGSETKIKTELSVTETFIKGHKEDFGVALYDAFAAAEDNEGFLPTDRQIRNVYDTCRQDLTALEQQKRAKEEEIVELGGKRPSAEIPTVHETQTISNTTSMTMTNTTYSNNPDGGYQNPTSYGATSTSQTSPYPTTTLNPPAMQMNTPAMQVAGTGMFSHPVPNSGGYSDNSTISRGYSNNAPYSSAPADPFSTNTSQNYSAPQPPTADPFSVFSSSSNLSTLDRKSVV